jgi:hypothetical protein
MAMQNRYSWVYIDPVEMEERNYQVAGRIDVSGSPYLVCFLLPLGKICPVSRVYELRCGDSPVTSPNKAGGGMVVPHTCLSSRNGIRAQWDFSVDVLTGAELSAAGKAEPK